MKRKLLFSQKLLQVVNIEKDLQWRIYTRLQQKAHSSALAARGLAT